MSSQRFSISEYFHRNSKASRVAGYSSDVEVHHRDITGGGARAAIFGVSDGLVSNIALILGVSGAHPSAPFVRLAGLAGLIGGALSMSMGEYVSMKAQKELFEKEIAIEANEIDKRPEAEQRELVQLYRKKGVPKDVAENFVGYIMKDPDLALNTHAREELGIDPASIGSPIQAAVSSLVSFSIGAILPLIPWFFTTGFTGVIYAVFFGAIGSIAVGVLLAQFTGRSVIKTALRQFILSGLAAGITYLAGHLIGFSGT